MAHFLALCQPLLKPLLGFIVVYALQKLNRAHVAHILLQLFDFRRHSRTSLETGSALVSTFTEKHEQDLSIIKGPSQIILDNSIIHAFKRSARKYLHQEAVVDHTGRRLTYRELEGHILNFSEVLRHHGVSRGARVCLLTHRSIPHLVAIFAVLRLGAAYVPLDGVLIPDGALVDVLQDAAPAIILVSDLFQHRVECLNYRYVCLEDIFAASHSRTERLESLESTLTMPGVEANDAAYVIYTSGTTGKPKGVCVSHRSILNLVTLRPGNLEIVPGMRVAQVLNIAFDMCAWEIFGCLLNGGTLHLRGPRRTDWMETFKAVDVLICTPSILEPHDPAEYPNIKVVATAGEPCPQGLADRWAKTAAFYNCCGPTEVTIVNTMHLHKPGTSLSIGAPTPNNAVYVLDEDLRPVSRGKPGTMWAGGLGVSHGYLNRPDLNCCKFRDDPFFGGVMYNTGDLGRLRDDGRLDHLGRADDQVKIKGFRVELDGVKAAMQTCPGVKSACALLINSELWGFYSPQKVTEDEVRAVMLRLQPPYAIPVKFITLHDIPLTMNGKIDKSVLRKFATC